MYSYITIVATPDGKKQGLGQHKFQTPPRIGEFITLEENGIGFIYKVLAIIHPEEPTVNVGDLYIPTTTLSVFDSYMQKRLNDLFLEPIGPFLLVFSTSKHSGRCARMLINTDSIQNIFKPHADLFLTWPYFYQNIAYLPNVFRIYQTAILK
jgi:hypothetical protein